MSDEEVLSKDAWTSRHEWDGHSHEEREAPPWIYWVIVGFSLGVMAYIAYEQWRESRMFQAAVTEWTARARTLLAQRVTEAPAKETDETPSAASETV